jgi:restriction endonuclease fold toxin 7 of polymorphic toxin system
MRPDDPFADQDTGDPQSWNLYSYVRNNPLSNTDPSGNACVQGSDGKYSDDNSGGESCAQVDVNNATTGPSVTVRATDDDVSYQLANDVSNLTSTSSLSEVGVNGILGAQTAEGIWSLPSLFRSGADLIASWRMASKMAGVRAAGEAGEALAGIVKNTERIPSLSGTAAYRVPDILDNSAKVIGEVKNYNGTVSLTAQIKDDIAFAQQNGYTIRVQIRRLTIFPR